MNISRATVEGTIPGSYKKKREKQPSKTHVQNIFLFSLQQKINS